MFGMGLKNGSYVDSNHLQFTKFNIEQIHFRNSSFFIKFSRMCCVLGCFKKHPGCKRFDLPEIISDKFHHMKNNQIFKVSIGCATL